MIHPSTHLTLPFFYYSIRLYYQRVDGCCDFCKPEPIQILKRGIFPGDIVTGGWQPGAGNGFITVNSNPSSTATDTNVFYVIVFNREITPSPAIVSNPSGDLRLRTPLGVNWNTYVLQNSPTGGEVLNNNIYSVNRSRPIKAIEPISSTISIG